jgi:iron complex transport system ATP-binding protein
MRRRDLALRVSVLLQDEEADFWGSALDYVMLGRYPRSGSAFVRDEEGSKRAQSLLAEPTWPGARRRATARSGGERQRARVAQALLQDADVLLVDAEPLQHLDLRHQAVVMRARSPRAMPPGGQGGKCRPARARPRRAALRIRGFTVLMRAARAWGAQATC